MTRNEIETEIILLDHQILLNLDKWVSDPDVNSELVEKTRELIDHQFKLILQAAALPKE